MVQVFPDVGVVPGSHRASRGVLPGPVPQRLDVGEERSRHLRLLLRLGRLALRRRAARGSARLRAFFLLYVRRLLGLALGLVALHARLLHARVLRFALLVVAALLGDVVGGVGLGVGELLLRLGLVLLVLRVQLGLGDLLLGLGLGHADVLGVGLHAVALRLVGLRLLLDGLFFRVVRLAVGGVGALLGARLGRVAVSRLLRGLRLRSGREGNRYGQRDAGNSEFHGWMDSL